MIIPVILSGGAGSRLWPLSRASHPKPFLRLPDGNSLLQKTLIRALSVKNIPEIITITNKEYFLKTKSEYETIFKNYPIDVAQSFLLEPFSKNTASAITLAMLKVKATYGDDAVLLILPADHLIEDITQFLNACEQAVLLAKKEKMVTFGVTPCQPETGFGYIERGDPYETGFSVKRFIEKPSIELTTKFVNSGRHFWNAGIFCFTVKTLHEQLSLYAPTLMQHATACWDNTLPSLDHKMSVYLLHATHFSNFDDISIDYALLEKSNCMAMVPCHFDWQDIGSWTAYQQLHPTDSNGNTVCGQAIVIDSHNTFIHSENRMVASIGLNSLFVVDTPDALLISHKNRAQEVKKLAKKIKNNVQNNLILHSAVKKPWGEYTVLYEEANFKVKQIVVNPGAALSLQSHQHRSEHWIFVEGEGTVTVDDNEYLKKKNDYVFIPKTSKHRLSNPGKCNLVVIEVQFGDYLGEDDIVRYEDRYGRLL